MPSIPVDFIEQIRRVLDLAGFHVADEADDAVSGLSVSVISGGVLVKWVACDDFVTLVDGLRVVVAERGGGAGSRTRGIVHTAVAGVLAQLGHTVAESSDGGVLVLQVDG
ncbi:hypothetical protein [Streptomyces chartreusis]|uniref:hypothetical protein n=1 Tax=Streptomyces chartreusis TaxID=1969 RepID=UPI002F913646|nr:hypothetical protein OG938_46325 [Streptomyces chartreusis]WTA33499.1 hypothetical protein OIA45_46790 [Streptomyces chartreusis]